MTHQFRQVQHEFTVMRLVHKKLIKQRLIRAVAHTGMDRLSWPAFGGMGSILMLHRVVEDDSRILSQGLTVGVAVLEHLIRHVKHLGYDIVTLDEANRRLVEGRRGNRFVCFTFDDGYADTLSLALPVFRHHGIPLAVYVAEGFLDRSATYWWGALERVILQNDRVTLLEADQETVYATRTEAEKIATYHRLVARAHADMPRVLPQLEDLFRRHHIMPSDLLDEDALTLAQARELAADPLVEIGAHGLSHRALSCLDLEDARREIEESRARLQDHLKIVINHFAYPYGSRQACGRREAALVRDAGFRTATTTRSGTIFAEHRDDIFLLPRLGVTNEWASPAVVRLQLSGTVSVLKRRFSRHREVGGAVPIEKA
jgi:peptidoglycan/xylan/chitin deacetylase (PgdA/CDA1 family)